MFRYRKLHLGTSSSSVCTSLDLNVTTNNLTSIPVAIQKKTLYKFHFSLLAEPLLHPHVNLNAKVTLSHLELFVILGIDCTCIKKDLCISMSSPVHKGCEELASAVN